LKTVRAGIGRVREELEAITGEQVVEVTGDNAGNDLAPSRLYVGTEAVLHQVARAELVAFLDFDQELLAPRYRASEQALALLVRAARLVGGRHSGGRVLVQTRLPHHEAIQAALRADPSRVASVEAERRRLLRFPPEAAMAVISGAAAERFVAALSLPPGAEISGPSDGRWLLRAPDHQMLCDVLASTPRPSGRLRVEVDPLRI
jgi:primosomal protein N' (replication factor Y)